MYRSFIDGSGKRWEVWLVLPTSRERRSVERRVLADRRAEPRDTPERRSILTRRNSRIPWLFLPAGYSSGWLCFQSGEEKRRLAPPPKDWESVTSQDLAGLLMQAKRVVRCG